MNRFKLSVLSLLSLFTVMLILPIQVFGDIGSYGNTIVVKNKNGQLVKGFRVEIQASDGLGDVLVLTTDAYGEVRILDARTEADEGRSAAGRLPGRYKLSVAGMTEVIVWDGKNVNIVPKTELSPEERATLEQGAVSPNLKVESGDAPDVEFKDTGIKLKLTPQVTADDRIDMKIETDKGDKQVPDNKELQDSKSPEPPSQQAGSSKDSELLERSSSQTNIRSYGSTIVVKDEKGDLLINKKVEVQPDGVSESKFLWTNEHGEIELLDTLRPGKYIFTIDGKKAILNWSGSKINVDNGPPQPLKPRWGYKGGFKIGQLWNDNLQENINRTGRDASLTPGVSNVSTNADTRSTSLEVEIGLSRQFGNGNIGVGLYAQNGGTQRGVVAGDVPGGGFEIHAQSEIDMKGVNLTYEQPFASGSDWSWKAGIGYMHVRIKDRSDAYNIDAAGNRTLAVTNTEKDSDNTFTGVVGVSYRIFDGRGKKPDVKIVGEYQRSLSGVLFNNENLASFGVGIFAEFPLAGNY